MKGFKDIPSYEGRYSVSSKGEVFSYKAKRLLKPQKINNGYYIICLGDKSKRFLVHRLVAITFISNNNKLGFVDHINGNRIDNRIENLRWCTKSENNRFSKKRPNTLFEYKGVAHGNGRGKFSAKITYNYKSFHIGTFKTAIEAAKAYNEKAKELFGKFALLNELS